MNMGSQEDIPVGIIGASGYGGVQLTRLLLEHPHVQLAYLGGDSSAGRPFADLYPHLGFKQDLKVEAIDLDKVVERTQVVFLALPNGLAAEMAPTLVERGCKVLDLSADYRFTNLDTYEDWYGTKRQDRELASTAVYGLPELYRQGISTASLVGCPGCFPTASLLALAPCLNKGSLIRTVPLLMPKPAPPVEDAKPKPICSWRRRMIVLVPMASPIIAIPLKLNR